MYGKMDPNHTEKMAIACKLWRDAGNPTWPAPVNWLRNQDNMRMMYTVICMGLAEGRSRPDVTPEFVKYNEFMYNEFLPRT